jgi:hypothetical protein
MVFQETLYKWSLYKKLYQEACYTTSALRICKVSSHFVYPCVRANRGDADILGRASYRRQPPRRLPCRQSPL